MKTLAVLVGILVVSVLVTAQSPVATSAECSKNVSFAATAGGQPVASVPSFVAHLVGTGKHQARYPGLCFAQSPDPRAKNYVVVFATQPDSFTGLVPSVMKYINAAPVSEDTTVNTIYGEMWHYTSNQPAADSTTTVNLLHIDNSPALFVHAYNEQGTAISQLSLKDVSGWMHTREKLVERVLADIKADSRPLTAAQGPLKTSLPVYYVNCDVPVKSLAGQQPTVSPPVPAPTAAPPVPVASLDFASSPAAADVYLNGKLVGQTPSSVTVPPGAYTITMRKQNFGLWERQMQVSAGKRRVFAALEQKTLTLSFPASSGPPEPTRKDPPPDGVLEISSNPPAADIFVDGGYVGKTPYSLAVPVGEHTITLRKKDGGTWQRKMLVASGKGSVRANLEQPKGPASVPQ